MRRGADARAVSEAAHAIILGQMAADKERRRQEAKFKARVRKAAKQQQEEDAAAAVASASSLSRHGGDDSDSDTPQLPANFQDQMERLQDVMSVRSSIVTAIKDWKAYHEPRPEERPVPGSLADRRSTTRIRKAYFADSPEDADWFEHTSRAMRQEEGQALVLALFQHLWLSEHLHRQANISLHGTSTASGGALGSKGLGSQLAVAPTPAQAAALQATLERLSKLYSVVYGLVVTSVVKSKQAGPEYRNLTLAYLHHILTLSCIKLFQQLGKHDEDLPRSAPVDAYLAPVTGHQLVLHPFAERIFSAVAVLTTGSTAGMRYHGSACKHHVDEVLQQVEAMAAKEAAGDVVTQDATGRSITVPRPMITALSSMRTVERLEALLPLEAHPRRAPGSPQAGARAVAVSTASSASFAPTGTSPPSAPKTWMTPAEEQVAITALLVRGREKLIDYVGEGEMEGVGVGRPQSPARSLARSSSRQGRRMSDPDIRDIPSRSQHRFVKTWYPPTVPLYVRTGRSGSVSLVPDPDAHPLSEGMSPPGSGQGNRGAGIGVAEALSPTSSSSSSDGYTPAHASAVALARARTPGGSGGTSLLPALSPPATAASSSTRHLTRSRTTTDLSAKPRAQGQSQQQPGARKHPGRGATDMGLGSPVAKGRTPPPLHLSGLLDASETATAYAVAQKRVTTEYLHSPLVMHKGGGAGGKTLGGQSRSRLHVVVPVTATQDPSPSENWAGALVQSSSEHCLWSPMSRTMVPRAPDPGATSTLNDDNDGTFLTALPSPSTGAAQSRRQGGGSTAGSVAELSVSTMQSRGSSVPAQRRRKQEPSSTELINTSLQHLGELKQQYAANVRAAAKSIADSKAHARAEIAAIEAERKRVMGGRYDEASGDRRAHLGSKVQNAATDIAKSYVVAEAQMQARRKAFEAQSGSAAPKAAQPPARRSKWGLEGGGEEGTPFAKAFDPDEVPITDKRVAIMYRIKKIRENPTQHLEGSGNLKGASGGGTPTRTQPPSPKSSGSPVDAADTKDETAMVVAGAVADDDGASSVGLSDTVLGLVNAKEQRALQEAEERRFDAEIQTRLRDVTRLEALSPLGPVHGRVTGGAKMVVTGDPAIEFAAKAGYRRAEACTFQSLIGAKRAMVEEQEQRRQQEEDSRKQREEVLAFLKGGRGSNSRVRVATPTAAAVAGVGGPGEDIAWLPTPEEATSTRIKHCREFQAFAKEQIRPVPVVMHREIVAGLDSRDYLKPVTATELEQELWSPQSTIV